MSESDTNDIEVLLPGRTVIIREEEVIVREFTFLEGLGLVEKIQPLLSTLADLFDREHEQEDPDGYHVMLLKAFHENPEITQTLLEISTGKKAKWIKAVGAGAGQALVLNLFLANKDFFMQGLVLVRAARRKAASKTESVDSAK